MKIVKNYVNGEWIAPKGDHSQDIFNPATGEVLGNVTFSISAEVDAACTILKNAFERI